MIIDLSVIDTTPGSAGHFAPPADVGPDEPVTYFAWAKPRMASDPLFRQLVGILVHQLHGKPHSPAPMEIIGPHAQSLRQLVASVDRRSREITAQKERNRAPT